jgi:hypothetical protein
MFGGKIDIVEEICSLGRGAFPPQSVNEFFELSDSL